MARRKLAHFAEMKTMPHVFEFPREMKGRWSEHFGNSNPIVIEIGCGQGDYVLGLSKLFPDFNYIGIDIKGSRMWHGAKAVEADDLKNVAFLRTRVEQLEDYFENGEINTVWVTFPDPHPRDGKAKKRLVSDRFLPLYKNVLGTGGRLFFKTDNQELFEYGLETIGNDKEFKVIQFTRDLYKELDVLEAVSIQTTYEKKFLSRGLSICFLEAHFQLVAE